MREYVSFHLQLTILTTQPRKLLPLGGGQSVMAHARIVAMAESLGVPMIEDVALTRAIYREVAVGEPILNTFYAPVAAVLRVIEDEKILLQNL